MGSESTAKASWAIDSEPMRARGIIYCFSKIQLVGQKNIETKHLLQVKARLKFALSWHFSLIVGYN